MKHLNNRGYVLVEVVLASLLTMVIAYFMVDLTIKLKNKNDDLMVKTLVSTDQAIIYNTIMRDLYDDASDFECSNIAVLGNSWTYENSDGDKWTNIVSDYATISYVADSNCSVLSNKITINIPIKVKQLEDDFSVNIEFNK